MLRRQSTSFELTLSLFAVIVLTLGVSIWLVIPEVKNYLRLTEEVRTAVQKSDGLQMEYDRLYEKKETMEAEEAALSDRFENRVDTAQLHQWIRTVWTDAAVKASSGDGTYDVTATISSPMEFYGFIDRFDTAPWVLRMGPSVGFYTEGGVLKVAFTLRAATKEGVQPPLQK
jgi:FtsZ-binding cell division protein ZapB